MTDRLDVIAAFADGEHVAGPDLEAALDDAQGRAYLIDILALRGLLDGSRATVVGGLPPSRKATAQKTRWLAAVAALVFMGVAGGYLAGRQSSSIDRNPNVEVTAQAPVAAPAPTHVIRIENGVNWNERAGGN